MNVIYPLLLLALALCPLLLALRGGDALLNRLEALQRRRRLLARLRSTQRLPVREEVMKSLIEGESRLQSIEARISIALSRLSRLPLPISSRGIDPARAAHGLERPILKRESHFSVYLDVAWLQSETLDTMDLELKLLRRVAGLPEDWPGHGHAERPPQTATESSATGAGPATSPARQDSPGRSPAAHPPRSARLPLSSAADPSRPDLPSARAPSSTAVQPPETRSPAADRLMQSLREASKKRHDIDRRLQRLGRRAGQTTSSEDDDSSGPASPTTQSWTV